MIMNDTFFWYLPNEMAQTWGVINPGLTLFKKMLVLLTIHSELEHVYIANWKITFSNR